MDSRWVAEIVAPGEATTLPGSLVLDRPEIRRHATTKSLVFDSAKPQNSVRRPRQMGGRSLVFALLKCGENLNRRH